MAVVDLYGPGGEEPETRHRSEPPTRIRPKAGSRRKVPCSHCSVPTPMTELTSRGLCRLCLDEEGAPIDSASESVGVAACRAAGLRAIARPCTNPDCKSCLTLLGRAASAPVERRQRERSAQFSEMDAECLKRHFSKPLRGGIGVGTGSSLDSGEGTNPQSEEQPQRTEPRCPICAEKLRTGRMGTKLKARKAPRPKTLGRRAKPVPRVSAADLLEIVMGEPVEEPMVPEATAGPANLSEADVLRLASPLTLGHRHGRSDREAMKPIRVYDKELPSGQLVQVRVMAPSIEPLSYDSHRIGAKDSGGGGKFGSWDDDAVDYVEAREGQTTITRILARLSETHRETLEAFYATQQEQGSSDLKLGPMAGVALLTRAAKEAHGKLAREGTTGTLRNAINVITKKGDPGTRDKIRREAEDLLREAQGAYAWIAAFGV